MIDLPELRRLRRVKRFDFWIAMAAAVGVLSAGVLLGVVIGILLSLGWLVYVATQPSMPLLGREAGTQVFRDLGDIPEDESLPRCPVLRIDGGLFFATAEALDERVARSSASSLAYLHAGAGPGGCRFRGRTGCRQAEGDQGAH